MSFNTQSQRKKEVTFSFSNQKVKSKTKTKHSYEYHVMDAMWKEFSKCRLFAVVCGRLCGCPADLEGFGFRAILGVGAFRKLCHDHISLDVQVRKTWLSGAALRE